MKLCRSAIRLLMTLGMVCIYGGYARGGDAADLRIVQESIGIMGTGSNMMRCGLVHSSGAIYLGTYGPQPAIIWKYDPRQGKLEKIAAPGEYQLDSMVEAPNGVIYIGTAYDGLVYRLDPQTNEIKNLGSPPIDSTPWIFTLIRTRSGDIYGAKGVGLFRLDWKNDRFEVLGLVPGQHQTLGPNSSNPIVRQLVETPSGVIYGDTNRWLFRFDPGTKHIEPLEDMVARDPACFAIFLPHGNATPTEDCYFTLFARFSSAAVKSFFYVYRAKERRVEPLEIEGFTGSRALIPAWYSAGGQDRLLVPVWFDQEQKLAVSVVDPFRMRLVEHWSVDSNAAGATLIPGGGLNFYCSPTTALMRGEPGRRRLVTLADNPTAAECVCLALSPQRVLGTDTYDCGYVFTRDLVNGTRRDHGRVWYDDHRCNFGPAAFAGATGNFFLANHGEVLTALWATDTATNRHWRIGDSAIQLVAMSDAAVWGTTGPNPSQIEFDPKRCWIPAWQANGGTLFRYCPGETRVDTFETLGQVGLVAEAPHDSGNASHETDDAARLLLTRARTLAVLDPDRMSVIFEMDLPDDAVAMAADPAKSAAYLLLANGQLLVCRRDRDAYVVTEAAASFGDKHATERGFFVLASGRVVGVRGDGVVTVYHPDSGDVLALSGPIPSPAGPAADSTDDVWYYADQTVHRFRLQPARVDVGTTKGQAD